MNFFFHSRQARPKSEEFFIQDELLVAQFARHRRQRISRFHPELRGCRDGRRRSEENMHDKKTAQQQR